MLHKLVKIFLLTSLIHLLVACGGGASGDNGGGINGTGIVIGRITQFGSIYVNGIRFDIDSASFTRDGVVSSGQEEFRIGEYIVINGSVDATTNSGIASEVIFTDLLEGTVTQVSTDNLSIEILGQKVNVDSLTTFHGTNDLNSLTIGNIVEVSGIKDANGLIKATSVTLKQEAFVDGISENELKGTISSINTDQKTLVINNILIDYSGAQLEGLDELKINQFVEIKSSSIIIGNTLIANEIELEDEYQALPESTKVEIEGIVTRFVSISDFDLNGIPVSINSTTKFENGLATNIRLNTSLKIEGLVNVAGILIAEEIDFKNIVIITPGETPRENPDEPESEETDESESEETDESESEETDESESEETDESESEETDEPESEQTDESESEETDEPESEETDESESEETDESESEETESGDTEESELNNTDNN